MKSPVRFMARGLAEAEGDGNPGIGRASPSVRPRIQRQRRGRIARGRRIAPGARVAAGDQPVDESGDDARAGHNLEMTAHDAFELQRVRMKGNEAEIAGE